MIVIQSSLGSALPVSAQRFVETLLGAVVGALTVTLFIGKVFEFGMAVFVIGIICTILQLEKNAYRFASITLAIVMLVTRTDSV